MSYLLVFPTPLSVSLSEALSAAGDLSFNGLKSISPEVASALVKSSKELALNGLTSITPAIAEILSKLPSPLKLNNLDELTPAIARPLSVLRGRLELEHLKRAHIKALELLAESSMSLLLGESLMLIPSTTTPASQPIHVRRASWDPLVITNPGAHLTPKLVKALYQIYNHPKNIALRGEVKLSLETAQALAKLRRVTISVEHPEALRPEVRSVLRLEGDTSSK